jgi:putative transposase
MRHTALMSSSVSLFHRHRFPIKIISHCVCLYFRFTLSFRDVEEMLAVRGVALSYGTVREWCLKFGQTYANRLRRKSPRPGDIWHLDEVFLKINGRLHYLWRAVDSVATSSEAHSLAMLAIVPAESWQPKRSRIASLVH